MSHLHAVDPDHDPVDDPDNPSPDQVERVLVDEACEALWKHAGIDVHWDDYAAHDPSPSDDGHPDPRALALAIRSALQWYADNDHDIPQSSKDPGALAHTALSPRGLRRLHNNKELP